MILLIDNYDSFVHNLARYVGLLGHERRVIRNDAMSAKEALAEEPLAIILSPGPKGPESAGISCALIEEAARRSVPLLGVCLGHQCIAQVFGGTVKRIAPVHGKPSAIRHDGSALFSDIPSPFEAARYHSLAVSLPQRNPLRATAHTQNGILMALAHESLPIYGVQFHPESVLTGHGMQLLENFLSIATAHRKTESADSGAFRESA